jgi:hypothetical protein
MDITTNTRRAMLERYLSNPTDEAWDKLKYVMYREAQAHGAQGFFPITSVSRDDLASQGFETSTVTDEHMAEIADHMQDAYYDDAFWVELDVIADDLGIPRKEGT